MPNMDNESCRYTCAYCTQEIISIYQCDMFLNLFKGKFNLASSTLIYNTGTCIPENMTQVTNVNLLIVNFQ